ncbi:hypothetical protein FPV67DRAFT_230975 [Lyophyllum atratum]|nr:hypothetical protein FPV67DRAFT_230975 [Lyophyllum atratum]
MVEVKCWGLRSRRTSMPLENAKSRLALTGRFIKPIHQPASIDSLPNEVLSIILCFTLEGVYLPNVARNEAPLSLTMVCSSWRAIAYSLPSLWASINVDLPNTLRTTGFAPAWLARSRTTKHRALGFRFVNQPIDYGRNILRTCLFPYVDSLVHLRLSMSYEQYAYLSSNLDNNTLRELQAIKFVVDGEPIEGPDDPFTYSIDFSNSRYLQDVHIEICGSFEFLSRSCIMGIGWYRLTDLILVEEALHPLAALDILVECLYLQRCQLLLHGFQPGEPPLPDLELITMYDLVSWEVKYTGIKDPTTGVHTPTTLSEFFKLFNLPSIETLSIESLDEGGAYDPDLLRALAAAARYSTSPETNSFILQNFTLKNIRLGRMNHLVPFLRMTPELRNLTLEAPPGTPDTFLNLFLDFTFRKGMSKESPWPTWLPFLERLDIVDNARYSAEGQAHASWVVEFLKSRRWGENWPGCEVGDGVSDRTSNKKLVRIRNNPYSKKMRLSKLESFSIEWRDPDGQVQLPSVRLRRAFRKLVKGGLEVRCPDLLQAMPSPEERHEEKILRRQRAKGKEKEVIGRCPVASYASALAESFSRPSGEVTSDEDPHGVGFELTHVSGEGNLERPSVYCAAHQHVRSEIA